MDQSKLQKIKIITFIREGNKENNGRRRKYKRKIKKEINGLRLY